MEKSNEETIFRAFGKEFDRDQAEWLIFSDKRTDIAYAKNTDVLQEIIQFGFQGTDRWTDKELQEALDDLCEENIVYHGENEENIKLPITQVKKLWFKGKDIDREVANKLMSEYYKTRIMLREDNVLLNDLLNGYVCSVINWSYESLQKFLDDISKEAEIIKSWPHSKFHDILDGIAGQKKINTD